MKVKICTLKPVSEVFPEIDFRAFEAARLLGGQDYEVTIKVGRYEYPLTCSGRDYYIEHNDRDCTCSLYDPESDSPQQSRRFPKTWLKNFREVDNGKLSEEDEADLVAQQIVKMLTENKGKTFINSINDLYETAIKEKYQKDLFDKNIETLVKKYKK